MYSALHQLVFGDDRSDDALRTVEEGAAAGVTNPRETAAEQDSVPGYWVKLGVCVVGLQVSYLTWGVLQVCVTSYLTQ